MKKILYSLFTLLILGISNFAQAQECRNQVIGGAPVLPTPFNYTIPGLNNITVDPTVPDGTVLYTFPRVDTRTIGNARGWNMYCTLGVGIADARGIGTRGAYETYPTPFPGIGLRIYGDGAGGAWTRGTWPRSYDYGPVGDPLGNRYLEYGGGEFFALVKTGVISASGTIPAREVARATVRSQSIVSLSFRMGAITINRRAPAVPTCSVSTPSQNQSINLGNDYKLSDFAGVGSMTPTRDVNIALDCAGGDAGQSARILMTMSDATTPANRTDILSLGAASTASGVGVRIERDAAGTPVVFGADSSAIGNPGQWEAATVATGTPTVTIPLKARMIQSAPAITGGSVRARATFTMAYN
ncbi:fimbrial protein [Collimonas antrihumi]|uniref:fimbrial protein n=1 Tax=Collimonas antrihumi TaxID=1940615 RepID=UPI001B8CA1B3|nr:fimbrial protein [Collimonas antrihumi]